MGSGEDRNYDRIVLACWSDVVIILCMVEFANLFILSWRNKDLAGFKPQALLTTFCTRSNLPGKQAFLLRWGSHHTLGGGRCSYHIEDSLLSPLDFTTLVEWLFLFFLDPLVVSSWVCICALVAVWLVLLIHPSLPPIQKLQCTLWAFPAPCDAGWVDAQSLCINITLCKPGANLPCGAVPPAECHALPNTLESCLGTQVKVFLS